MNVHALCHMYNRFCVWLSALAILVNITTLSGQSSMDCVSEDWGWVGG